MLQKLSVELLLGQLAYQQKCDIYNYTHQYNSGLKKKNPCAVVVAEGPTPTCSNNLSIRYVCMHMHNNLLQFSQCIDIFMHKHGVVCMM